MAQTQSQIRLHVGSAILDPVPQLTDRLHSARLAVDDVAGGSDYADVSANWTLPLHDN